MRDAAGLADREPCQPGDEKAGCAIGPERRGESQVVGEQSARKRTDADGEDERSVIDRHRAPTAFRRGDVRQHDLARGQDETGTGTRHEAGDDEFGKAAGFRAPEVAESRDNAADGQRGASAEPVAELTRRHRDDESRQSVDGDRQADRRRGNPERLRVQRERRHHAAETELVDGDEHAHPDQDPPLEGRAVASRFRPAHDVTRFDRTSRPRLQQGGNCVPPSGGPSFRGTPLVLPASI